ncbi:MAG: pitrilysin family protein [Candidatus Berkelbacteria bacterium]|nr:pitrilysin family protein [Candidatus Berkelbacteria bacterium]
MINFNLKTLPNGLRLVTAPNQNTEAVTIFIQVGVGGRFENNQQKGISHFLEHLFFKGSKNRPTTFEIVKELDSIGANYNAFTGEEATGFFVQSEARDFEKSFAVISDMYLNPLFDEKELEREKGVILQESNMYRDMPQAFVQILNQRQMFGDHPLGYDLVGDQEHIKKIQRPDIVSYREKYYLPENTIITICGNSKGANWQETVEKHFSEINGLKQTKPLGFRDNKVKDKLVQEIRKVDQTHLVLSYLGISKTDKRRYALGVLNTILGGGMSSRLFMEIREKRALAYYVKSSTADFLDTGLFSIYAGVKPEALQETIKIIFDQIEDIKKNGPNEEELERAKGNLRGSLAISLEDSLEIAGFLADELFYQNKVRSVGEIVEAVGKVSGEEVCNLANEIFAKDRMGLAVIGPRKYEITL